MTFDGPNKLVILTSSTLSLISFWGAYKTWIRAGNAQYAIGYETEGGRPIDPVAGTLSPLVVFQRSGWKIRPMEADHTLTVTDGTLVDETDGDPFVSTVGDYTVRIRYQQPVQAIGYSTEGGSGSGPTATEIAEAVWNSSKALTVAKFLGLK